MWMILGTFVLFFAILSGMYISYRYVYYVFSTMILLKIFLTYKTDEFFSLHHLLQ